MLLVVLVCEGQTAFIFVLILITYEYSFSYNMNKDGKICSFDVISLWVQTRLSNDAHCLYFVVWSNESAPVYYGNTRRQMHDSVTRFLSVTLATVLPQRIHSHLWPRQHITFPVNRLFHSTIQVKFYMHTKYETMGIDILLYRDFFFY